MHVHFKIFFPAIQIWKCALEDEWAGMAILEYYCAVWPLSWLCRFCIVLIAFQYADICKDIDWKDNHPWGGERSFLWYSLILEQTQSWTYVTLVRCFWHIFKHFFFFLIPTFILSFIFIFIKFSLFNVQVKRGIY